MNETIHLTLKERRVYFFKLLTIYAAGVLLFGFIIFWNAMGETGVNAEKTKNKIAEYNQVNARQSDAVQLMDTISINLDRLKGDDRQVFLEKDVQNMTKQLAALYNDNSTDLRYVAFVQAGNFMNMRLEDIVTLNKKVANIRLFEKQLNDCRIGYRNNQQ